MNAIISFIACLPEAEGAWKGRRSGIEQKCCVPNKSPGASEVVSCPKSFVPFLSITLLILVARHSVKMKLLACLSLTFPFAFAFPTAENFAKLSPSASEIHDLITRLQHEKRLVADLSGKPIDGV